MSGPEDQARYVTVARLVRARGNRGELAAELETDDAAFLSRCSGIHLWDGAERREPARIQETWPHKNRLIFKFEGIDTIEQAERLAGWQVQIPAGERPEPAPGRYYVTDLVGCRVVEARSGRVVGEVAGWMETGATPLLRVAGAAGEVLVPFAASICVEVDPAARVIRVELPEGLEEL